MVIIFRQHLDPNCDKFSAHWHKNLDFQKILGTCEPTKTICSLNVQSRVGVKSLQFIFAKEMLENILMQMHFLKTRMGKKYLLSFYIEKKFTLPCCVLPLFQ